MKRIWLATPREGVVMLEGTEHNHIANVLRLRVGDSVTAMSGDEFDRTYKIENITKRQTVLAFTGRTKNQCNPVRPFTVYLGLIKPDNLALVAQKINELGAGELKLFSSKFCAVKSANIDRLNEIARQSCKQCGRSVPLLVSYIGGMDKLTAELSRYDRAAVLFADEELSSADTTPAPTIPAAFATAPLAFVVGCEGGFDEPERAAISAVATPISLGRRILRAETAAIAGTGKWCM